jgi:hypothetical protein
MNSKMRCNHYEERCTTTVGILAPMDLGKLEEEGVFETNLAIAMQRKDPPRRDLLIIT